MKRIGLLLESVSKEHKRRGLLTMSFLDTCLRQWNRARCFATPTLHSRHIECLEVTARWSPHCGLARLVQNVVDVKARDFGRRRRPRDASERVAVTTTSPRGSTRPTPDSLLLQRLCAPLGHPSRPTPTQLLHVFASSFVVTAVHSPPCLPALS